MKPAELTYETFEAEEAAGQLDTFLAAYEEVYEEPPYREGPSDVAEFIQHYQVHAKRAGMRLIIARDGDEVVGFTYGYLLPADSSWWANIQDADLSEDFTRETGTRTWVILELAVRKAWRRLGIAKTLHALLLHGLDVERVTLTVRPEPEAKAAQSAYAAWGYREVGLSHPWEEAPFYTAMVLNLDEPAT
ncbi:putative acetyltransferase [Actinacidiphila reveromycinica]|uniref:Putative acetyltransferase n=1 Tax=Actinacidiphila reveromycinica TaxID=659352 RepID=A0A7U3UTD0_9ACTN|nr:GNAT family N-acetyltransferase [Streptomyces sp. SN-593]BBA98380.1 putative acetyltransferase [Streptomyces sp. SN-593]